MYLNGSQGNSTLTGAIFENQTDLKECLKKNNIDISNIIFLKKNDFPKYFTEKTNCNMQDIFGKVFLPDEAIIFNNNLIIIEKKYQQTPGSVDEKLQTGPYKLSIYKKCAELLHLNKATFSYLVNSSWFNKEKYTIHLFPWLKENNIEVYFDNIPLNKILI